MLIKRIGQTIKKEAKEQKGRFHPNALKRKGVIRAGEELMRADQHFKCCLIL